MTRGAFYVTTPIYYVNDRPHIGHLFTTVLADVLARFHRLRGDDTFFLTGTDEHAAKVADAARAHGLSPIAWSDQNAAEFQQAFGWLGVSHDDFIRTSEDRHKERVERYVRELIASGDVYLGQYEGWYDAGEEEYVPENKAKEHGFLSPISGRPLVRRSEENYFFRLSAYADRLLAALDQGETAILPEARKNEVLGRIREGLNDIPISRAGAGDWGIRVPGDPRHTVYVWIDALFNYVTAVDTDERRGYWPADVHLVGKDILWFHTVIWFSLLMALRERPGYGWVKLPRAVYAHSFWMSDGRKMSKSLGNFIDLERLHGYAERFGIDGLRWFLATQGPLGTTDSDFSRDRFAEVYNTDLANALGNCVSRVVQMTRRYFDGRLPPDGALPAGAPDLAAASRRAVGEVEASLGAHALDRALAAGIGLVREVDGFIEKTQPFKLAKDPTRKAEVGAVLYQSAEALRVASLLLWPAMPAKVEELWKRIGCQQYAWRLATAGRGRWEAWTAWGRLTAGTTVHEGKALFPRWAEPAPAGGPSPSVAPAGSTSPAPSAAPAASAAATASAATTAAGPAPLALKGFGFIEGAPSAASASSASAPSDPKRKGKPVTEPTTTATGGAPASAAPAPAAAATAAAKAEISYEQFAALDLRIARVVHAEPVPKTDKLLKVDLELDGGERRTVLSGIRAWYAPESLVGRQVVYLKNLAPRVMRGVRSEGMILAANGPGGEAILLQPERAAPDGAAVS